MNKTKIITLIVGAALIGALTESAKFIPNLAEVFVAANLLISAITSVIVGKKEA